MLSRMRSLGSFSPQVWPPAQPRGGGASRAPAALPRARSDSSKVDKLTFAPERSFSRKGTESGAHTVFLARSGDGRAPLEPFDGKAVRATGAPGATLHPQL